MKICNSLSFTIALFDYPPSKQGFEVNQIKSIVHFTFHVLFSLALHESLRNQLVSDLLFNLIFHNLHI